MDRYGLSMGDGPRFEMYIYVADLVGAAVCSGPTGDA
jgi:hypothetical protein